MLAGGKAERLGEAGGGRPKSLVLVGDEPLLAYQVGLLVRAGVDRVIVSCAAGQGPLFEEELAGLGAKIVPVEEPQPLGRGGGLRFAAAARRDEGDVYALNGDELVDLDLRALVDHHRGGGAAATITVVPLESPLGIVELGRRARARVPREAPAAALGQLRRLRARRGGARAPAGARRPRDDDLPRARRRAQAPRLPARGLWLPSTPQGPARGGRRVRPAATPAGRHERRSSNRAASSALPSSRGASRSPGAGSSSGRSPSATAASSSSSRPGSALSLQYHERKDESLATSCRGRAAPRARAVGRGDARTNARSARATLPLPARDGAPRRARSRTRRSSRCRRPTSTTSSGLQTTTAARRHLGALEHWHVCVKDRARGRDERRPRRLAQSGWTPRMLRYVERIGPRRPCEDRERLSPVRPARGQPAPLAPRTARPVHESSSRTSPSPPGCGARRPFARPWTPGSQAPSSRAGVGTDESTSG